MDVLKYTNFPTEQRCRACLKYENENMIHLQENYQNTGEENIRNVAELLEICNAIKISPNDSFPQFICKTCLKRATDSYQFKLQCQRAAIQLQRELSKTVDRPTRMTRKIPKIICHKPNQQNNTQKCNKSNSDCREHLVRYKSKHESSQICSYCNESQLSSSMLAHHVEQMHAHLKTVKCGECDKTFFRAANLKQHLIVHSGVKKHMCEVCGMSFALSGNLTTHRRLHTGSKPYMCIVCGKGFTQQAALKSHEAVHSDRRDHICSDCGAAFSRPGALRNHCKRHLPIRPFVCTLCTKAFRFSSERKRHMTIHTGEKKHECNICGRRFNRSTNLTVHRRTHTGEKPHICLECGKKFSQAHCLRTHMTTHFI